MSDNQNRTSPTPPRTERWVYVMVLAFAPIIAALFLPDAARIPLVAIGGLMFLAAFLLMIHESRRSRDSESLRQLVHSGSE